MYPDNRLYNCPTCGAKSIYAQNLYGVMTWFHKIPSPRLAGYFTFTDVHQSVTKS